MTGYMTVAVLAGTPSRGVMGGMESPSDDESDDEMLASEEEMDSDGNLVVGSDDSEGEEVESEDAESEEESVEEVDEDEEEEGDEVICRNT